MGVRRIDPVRAKELLSLEEDYSYIDVRTAEEFDRGHVPEAINVPVMLKPKTGGIALNADFMPLLEKHFSRTQKIIVGCGKGGRARKAAELLSNNGYTNIFEMRGGYEGETEPLGKITFPGWSTRGYPTSTESSPQHRYANLLAKV